MDKAPEWGIPTFGRERIRNMIAESAMGEFCGIRVGVIATEFGPAPGWTIATTLGYLDVDRDGRVIRTGAWFPVEVLSD